jgi:hypothetical protein
MKTKKDKFYETLFLCLKWFGILILAHIVALCLFAIVLQDACIQLVNDFPNDPNKPILRLLIFDLIFTLLFFVLYNKILHPIAPSEKSAIKKKIKEGQFTLLSHWKESDLKSTVCAASMFALLQAPFVIFFASFGFSFTESIILDRFYVWEAGFYTVLGSALLGWILSSLFFSLCALLTRLISIHLVARRD